MTSSPGARAHAGGADQHFAGVLAPAFIMCAVHCPAAVPQAIDTVTEPMPRISVLSNLALTRSCAYRRSGRRYALVNDSG